MLVVDHYLHMLVVVSFCIFCPVLYVLVSLAPYSSADSIKLCQAPAQLARPLVSLAPLNCSIVLWTAVSSHYNLEHCKMQVLFLCILVRYVE